MTDHRHWDELAVGYAMRALEPEEEQQFEAHVRGCRVCKQSLVSYDAVLGQLAYAAEPVVPPPDLLDAIRAGIEQSGRPHADAQEPHSVEPPARRHAGAHPTRPRRFGRRRAARRRGVSSPASWRVGAVVLGCLAAVVGLAGWNVVLRADNDAQSTAASQRSAVINAIEQPGARTITLTSRTTGQTQALAVVRGEHLSLIVDGLSRLDSDHEVYVLWGQPRSGSATAIKAFDPTGKLQVVDAGALPSQLAQPVGFAITRESPGPLPAYPGGPPVAAGTIVGA